MRQAAGTSSRQARRRGIQSLQAVTVVTVSTFLLMAIWAVVAIFVDLPAMPPLIWEVAVLVAPIALAVFWRPAYRVPNCLWLTFCSAFFLGLGGALWGSWIAPAIGGATILAMLFVPRDGGWKARRR